jgi:hypothetical protein
MIMSLLLSSKFLWYVVLCYLMTSLTHKFVVWKVEFLILLIWCHYSLLLLIPWAWPEILYAHSCCNTGKCNGIFVLWRLLYTHHCYGHGLNWGLKMCGCMQAGVMVFAVNLFSSYNQTHIPIPTVSVVCIRCVEYPIDIGLVWEL